MEFVTAVVSKSLSFSNGRKPRTASISVPHSGVTVSFPPRVRAAGNNSLFLMAASNTHAKQPVSLDSGYSSSSPFQSPI
jgi:hypothetical protein